MYYVVGASVLGENKLKIEKIFCVYEDFLDALDNLLQYYFETELAAIICLAGDGFAHLYSKSENLVEWKDKIQRYEHRKFGYIYPLDEYFTNLEILKNGDKGQDKVV